MSAPSPSAALPPRLVVDLVSFARSRLLAGDGLDVVQRLGLAVPEILDGYGLGYFPGTITETLSRRDRSTLEAAGIDLSRWEDRVVFPIGDTDGLTVDLLVIDPREPESGIRLTSSPGLLGTALLATRRGQRTTIVSRLTDLAARFAAGQRDVLWLPPAFDPSQLATWNITPVIPSLADFLKAELPDRTDPRWANEAARPTSESESGRALPSSSLSLPASPASPASRTSAISPLTELPPPALCAEPIRLDATASTEGTWIANAGPVRFVVDAREDDASTRLVIVRNGTRSHRDRFDLTVAAACGRFVGSAAQKLTVDREALAAALAQLWPLIHQAEIQRDQQPIIVLDDDERERIDADLSDPQLLPQVCEDLGALGWIGDDAAKRFLYLTAISRLLPSPLWSVYQATVGAAPWQSLGFIAAITPPEDCVVFHRLTESLLRHTDRRSLRHKLLLVDRAETLRPEGALALRVLWERGSIGWQTFVAGDQPGVSPLLGDVHGPVAVIAASAGDLDRRVRDCFLTLTVDERPEQTAQVLAAQRSAHVHHAISSERKRTLIERHHALQRSLQRVNVRIPFADRIHFPRSCLRHRDEHAALLTLIQASALLHQRQREHDTEGCILANETDFHIAHDAIAPLVTTGLSLGRVARRLVQRAYAVTDGATATGTGTATGTATATATNPAATAEPALTMRAAAALIPDATRFALRGAITELCDLGYLQSDSSGGRGRERTYTWTIAAAGISETGICLHDVGINPVAPAVGELAAVGVTPPPSATPVRRVG